MPLQTLRQQSWLRTALAVLLLCFALGTLAHAGHTHEPHKAGDTHYHCDYCTSFGGLITPPAQSAPVIDWPVAAGIFAAPVSHIIDARPVGVAQARAPPAR